MDLYQIDKRDLEELIDAVDSFLPSHTFEIMGFESYQAMEDYTLTDHYIDDPERSPGICFGFALEDLDPGYNVKMFYQDQSIISR
jgi:hypothetical protein